MYVLPLKPVLRIATEQDHRTVEKNRQKEKEAFKICQEKIRKHGLEMKLMKKRPELVKEGETVLDMGTGNGIIPILLSAKTPGKHFTGLEIQADTAEMARRSVRYNDLEDRINIVTGDIKEAADIFRPAFFDVIITNPPYMLA